MGNVSRRSEHLPQYINLAPVAWVALFISEGSNVSIGIESIVNFSRYMVRVCSGYPSARDHSKTFIDKCCYFSPGKLFVVSTLLLRDTDRKLCCNFVVKLAPRLVSSLLFWTNSGNLHWRKEYGEPRLSGES